MLIQKVMFKYRLILLLIFPFYINSAFSQDNISLHLTHSHISSDYLDEFISCLNKNNLKIFKSAPKNPDFLIFFDKEDKLYKYYKSSIQINFYDVYRNDNSINEDIILFYYIDINEKQFKKMFNKNKNRILQLKRSYDVNITYHNNNALILLTSLSDILVDNKWIGINLAEENNKYLDAVNTIKNHCLK